MIRELAYPAGESVSRSSATLFYRDRRRARWSVVVLGTILLAGVCFVVWSLVDPEGHERLVEESWNQRLVVALPYALLLLPGLLALVVFEGRRAADDRPLLVIDERAIFYRDWRCGPIPWRDVRGCRPVEVEVSAGRGRQRMEWQLELRLTDPRKYLLEVHGGGEFSDGYMARYFRIPLRDVAGEKEEVLQAIRSRLG